MTDRRSISAAAALFVLGAMLTVLACSRSPGRFVWEDPEAWSVRLSADTEVFGYRSEDLLSRDDGTLVLREELRIGDESADGGIVFGAVGPRVAAGQEGRFYVLDPASNRVHAFDPSGELRWTAGRRGQGPGEYQRASSIAVTESSLAVFDLNQPGRVTLLSKEGEFRGWLSLGDHRATEIFGTGGSELYVYGTDYGADEHWFGRLSPDTGETKILARLQNVIPSEVLHGAIFLSWTGQMPVLAPVNDRRAYLMGTEGYEVAALADGRDPGWVLRLDWPRRRLAPEDRQYVLEQTDRLARLGPVDPSWIPIELSSLTTIRADEEGRLYVVPSDGIRREREDQPVRDYPVQVYSRSGTFLFAGKLAFAPFLWQSSADDRIYGARLDSLTLEWVVVRSRLEWP